MSIEAMKQALEYITATNKSSSFWMVPESNLNKTVTALRAAIAEVQKQEPWEQFYPDMGKPQLSSPAAQRQPLAYAGVTMWIGDKTVTQLVTGVEIRHEALPGMSIEFAAKKCLSLLTVHGIGGEHD